MAYTLKHLVAETGIPARRIRDYIFRGLLHGPDTRGRNARYSPYHVARLRDIDRLKRTERLSLAEIRTALLDPVDPPAGSAHFVSAARRLQARYAVESSTAKFGTGKTESFVRLLKDTMVKRVPPKARAVPSLRIQITPEIDFVVDGGVRSETIHLLERLADYLRVALLRAPSAKRKTRESGR